MNTLQTRTDHLVSIANYAKLVDKSRERIYQLINEKDERIEIVIIDGKWFVNTEKSAKTLD